MAVAAAAAEAKMLVQGQAGTVEKTGAQRMTGLSQAAFEEGGRGSGLERGWGGGGLG